MSDATKGKDGKKEKKSRWGRAAAALRDLFGRKARGAVQKNEPVVGQSVAVAEPIAESVVEERVFTEPELEVAATGGIGYEEERIEELDLSSLSLEELQERVSATTPTPKRTREPEGEVGNAGLVEQIRPVEHARPEEQARPVEQVRPVEQARPEEQASSAEHTQPVAPAPPIKHPPTPSANLVDINNATAEELMQRLGLRQLDAHKAISVCEAIGGFTSLQQFCDALGLRPHVIERLRPLVKIVPRRTKR